MDSVRRGPSANSCSKSVHVCGGCHTCSITVTWTTTPTLVLSPDHMQCVYRFQNNACSTESDPCWSRLRVWDRDYPYPCCQPSHNTRCVQYKLHSLDPRSYPAAISHQDKIWEWPGNEAKFVLPPPPPSPPPNHTHKPFFLTVLNLKFLLATHSAATFCRYSSHLVCCIWNNVVCNIYLSFK